MKNIDKHLFTYNVSNSTVISCFIHFMTKILYHWPFQYILIYTYLKMIFRYAVFTSKNYFMRNITNILICFGVSKLIAFVMQQNLFYKMLLSQKFKHNL